jgi:hypothetical protein
MPTGSSRGQSKCCKCHEEICKLTHWDFLGFILIVLQFAYFCIQNFNLIFSFIYKIIFYNKILLLLVPQSNVNCRNIAEKANRGE